MESLQRMPKIGTKKKTLEQIIQKPHRPLPSRDYLDLHNNPNSHQSLPQNPNLTKLRPQNAKLINEKAKTTSIETKADKSAQTTRELTIFNRSRPIQSRSGSGQHTSPSARVNRLKRDGEREREREREKRRAHLISMR